MSYREVMIGTRNPEETTSRAEPDAYAPHSALGKRNTLTQDQLSKWGVQERHPLPQRNYG
jgi:hypothetical protein